MHFIGQYHSHLKKDRIRLPAKLAYLMQDVSKIPAIVEKEGQYKFITCFPKKGRYEKRYNLDVSVTKADVKLILPKQLIKEAGLEKEIVFAGVLDILEIWPKSKFEKYNKRMPTKFPEL